MLSTRFLWHLFIAYILTMSIPFYPYRLFFLYVEPLSALGGAIYAGILPRTYLQDLTLITAWSAKDTALTTPVLMTLLQLSNLYLLFAINERVVLSSTNDIKLWKKLLFGLLVADFGHLLSLLPLGLEVYWRVWDWNAMMWGSVGFVYLGATLRLAFLFDVGLEPSVNLHEGSKRKE